MLIYKGTTVPTTNLKKSLLKNDKLGLISALILVQLNGATVAAQKGVPVPVPTGLGNSASGDGELYEPHSIDFDLNDNMFVIDEKNQPVQNFTNNGTTILDFALNFIRSFFGELLTI
jgi:hypothetical protein